MLRLRATYGTPGGATVAGLGLTLAGAVVARTALTATTYLRVTGRQALQQAQTARLVGRPAPALGAVLVEHSTGYARAEPAVSRLTRPPGCGYPPAWQGLAARHPRRPMPASARRVPAPAAGPRRPAGHCGRPVGPGHERVAPPLSGV